MLQQFYTDHDRSSTFEDKNYRKNDEKIIWNTFGNFRENRPGHVVYDGFDLGYIDEEFDNMPKLLEDPAPATPSVHIKKKKL